MLCSYRLSDAGAFDDGDPSRFCLEANDCDPGIRFRSWLAGGGTKPLLRRRCARAFRLSIFSPDCHARPSTPG